MNTELFSFALFFFLTNVLAENETHVYDQRQTGEYNIHISLKDVKIVAVLGGGLGGHEDYDYNYDYAEMTIKPTPGNNSTTTSTTTMATTTKKADVAEDIDLITTTDRIVEITPHSSSKPSQLSNVTVSPQTAIEEPNKNDSRPLNSTYLGSNIPVQIIVTPVEIQTESKHNTTESSLQLDHSSTTLNIPHQRDCIEGFRKDRNGNCRPKAKKPQQQTLLRKLIQLSRRLQPKRDVQ